MLPPHPRGIGVDRAGVCSKRKSGKCPTYLHLEPRAEAGASATRDAPAWARH